MTTSFHSGFADDIIGMMQWRGIRGYEEASYRIEMMCFDSFCSERFPDANILTWEIALAHLNFLRDRKDIRVPLAAIRNLGRYQIMMGKDACVFPADFFGHKKRPVPYIMNDGELRRFFEAADNYPSCQTHPLLTYTVAVFFRLQYSTGMRPQETRLLARSDFDFRNGTIYIADSKRHKDRRIPVPKEIMSLCQKYDAIARSIYPGTEMFFPNERRNLHGAQSIETFFHKCWDMAGNPPDLEYCTPYILRHNYATRMITRWMEEGKDFSQYMPYLSAYMGHRTFRETCYYLHLIPERLSRMACMDISDVVSEVGHEK